MGNINSNLVHEYKCVFVSMEHFKTQINPNKTFIIQEHEFVLQVAMYNNLI